MRHGYALTFHPLFVDQLEALPVAAEREASSGKRSAPAGANMKLLARLHHIVFEEVPADPGAARYRQGDTLGEDNRHWLRAKFGNGRFRLFFRYLSDPRIILFVWVNDQDSLRAYGSKSDAYAVFKKMLAKGNPPDEWDALLQAALNAPSRKRAIPLSTPSSPFRP